MTYRHFLAAVLLAFGSLGDFGQNQVQAQGSVQVPTQVPTPSDTPEFRPTQVPTAVPAYLYCQIICRSHPSWSDEQVLFDFGQQTGPWTYNYLSDSEGRPYLFHSGVQALNYLVARGWEFVQAFTTGKELSKTHLLLRIVPARLPEEVVAQLLAEPPHKPTAAERKNASEFGK